MAVRYYPAIVERGPSGFGVFFPDFPGCVSAGETLENVARNAEEALGLHIAGMAEDGDPLPEPSVFDAVPVDPDVNEAARLMVRAELPGRSVRVNMTMDEGLLAAVDKEAKRRDMSRSGLLALAARRELAQGRG